MTRIAPLLTAAAGLVVAIDVTGDPATAHRTLGGAPRAAAVQSDRPAGAIRVDGTPVRLGNGTVRAYVVRDTAADGAPLEIGVALDERALDGLPAPGTGHHGAHGEMHEYVVPLPDGHGTPFRFVELDWNPGGHEPPGVYDTPHFDFHFYTITKAERDAIDPADPRYAERADRLPAAELVPQFNDVPRPPGTAPSAMAVPRMGVHMVDMRTPELQAMLGRPDAFRPFTTTFIHGSWDGRVTFWEPMVTRDYILGKRTATDAAVRDEVIALPLPQRYADPGYYPRAYRIAWDGTAREHRIALT
jgi:hypothetical protein